MVFSFALYTKLNSDELSFVDLRILAPSIFFISYTLFFMDDSLYLYLVMEHSFRLVGENGLCSIASSFHLLSPHQMLSYLKKTLLLIFPWIRTELGGLPLLNWNFRVIELWK